MKTFNFILLLTLFCQGVVRSQSSTYSFSHFNDVYTPLPPNKIYGPAGFLGVATGTTLPWPDDFQFKIFGESKAAFSYPILNKFGNLILSSPGTGGLYKYQIAGIGLELQASSGGIGQISFYAEGSAPNRISKYEFENMSCWGLPSFVQRFNFQYWFYEADYSIEFRLGSVVQPALFNSLGRAVGIRYGDGPQYGLGLINDPANPVLTSQGNPFPPEMYGMAPENKVYRLVLSRLM